MMYEQNFHKRNISGTSFLVTGGAGFIGSNLVEYLLRHNAGKVVILDNFATGNRSNIVPFLKGGNCKLIEGDIRDLSTCKAALGGIDFVLHQAALGSVPRSINDPITSNEVNVSGFLNMLVAGKDMKIKRMVYAASSSTYGDSEALPKVEETIGRPLSPYAVTKYVNELYADVFYKTYGLETIGLRYFNVFGQRQDPNGAYAAVIPKFVSQLLSGEKIVINGDGEHSRDFTYVENVVQANILSLFAENTKAVNSVFNVACGENTSLNELYSLLKKALSEYEPSVLNGIKIYGPDRVGDVKHSLANIDKAKEILGYSPQYDIGRGIEEAVKWYLKNLKITHRK